MPLTDLKMRYGASAGAKNEGTTTSAGNQTALLADIAKHPKRVKPGPSNRNAKKRAKRGTVCFKHNKASGCDRTDVRLHPNAANVQSPVEGSMKALTSLKPPTRRRAAKMNSRDTGQDNLLRLGGWVGS
jgi:hypothetical protein